MEQDDVVRVYDLCDRAGIPIWLDGGWGVDALLHEQTRPHADLDIALRSQDVDAFDDLMRDEGFTLVRDDGPFNFVLGDGAGNLVDVHLVDVRETAVDASGTAVYGPNGLAYEVGSLEGVGRVAGRQVRCCTADFQVRSHTGYEIDADDVRDVLALHHRFGIPLPAIYRQRPS